MARRVFAFAVAASLLGLVLVAPSCAPLNAATAINDAESADEQARLAMAHQNAPYEYHLAKAYLRKAKLTEGYSEYNIAETYGKRARELFGQSIAQARENAMRLKIREQRTKGRK